MRIVIICDWFSENMGYAENCLPKALAELGHEVHLITSTAQVYYDHPEYEKIYHKFLGNNIVDPIEKEIDGYTLYRLPFKNINGIRIIGIIKLLSNIKPDLVQTFDVISYTNFILSVCKPIFKYKLFTGNHVVASVFPPARENQWVWGKNIYFSNNVLKRSFFFFLLTLIKLRRFKSSLSDFKKILITSSTDICYGATLDAADIAVRFYGLPKEKIKVCELGVDTGLFYPRWDKINNNILKNVRGKYGCRETDILCIYSGRFVENKNPLCLAQAVDHLYKLGKPYKALFIGNGPQKAEILSNRSCFVIDFQPFSELGEFYRVADIGVWPREESTSVLDASACGLPIVVSNRVQAIERIEGNGMVYSEGDYLSLAEVLLKLENKEVRETLGKLGKEKIENKYTWGIIAKNRIRDYIEISGKSKRI
jgi:glycosyltransferase involved in cell wall biosynthesis